MMYRIFYFDRMSNQVKYIWFMQWFSYWKCLEYMRSSSRYYVVHDYVYFYAPGQNIEVDTDGKLFYL